MQIDYLADRSGALERIASWLHDEWLAAAGYSREEAECLVAERLQSQDLPLALVARVEEEVVGTASLFFDVDPSLSELVTCVGGVYVAPEWRRQGIGTRLCRRVIWEAQRLGLSALHLYTQGNESFYERLGWQVLSRSTEPASFMACTFAAPAGVSHDDRPTS